MGFFLNEINIKYLIFIVLKSGFNIRIEIIFFWIILIILIFFIN